MVLANPSLLISDDDFAFRETLREVFEPQGYRTLLAGDGEQAWDILQHQTVHVALLDMHMPRLTGLETVQRVREFQIEVPCILLSAAMDEALAEAARRLRVFASVSKPVRLADLRRLVHDAISLFQPPAARQSEPEA